MPPREYISTISELIPRLSGGTGPRSIAGLTSVPSKAVVLSAMAGASPGRILVLTDSNDSAEFLASDIRHFDSEIDVEVFPSFESNPYSGLSPHAETEQTRARVLWRIACGREPRILVASSKAVLFKLPSPSQFRSFGLSVARSRILDPADAVSKLASVGYVRSEPLRNIGEFSVRGGIIDVWSPDSDLPVRIELFGDEVESIREFDPDTQLSTGKLDEIILAPMREFVAGPDDFRLWAMEAREKFTDDRSVRPLIDRTQFADEGEAFPGWEYLMPMVSPRPSHLLEYLGGYSVVIDEPTVVEKNLQSWMDSVAATFEEQTEAGEIALEPTAFALRLDELRSALPENRLEFRSLGASAAQTDDQFSLSENEGDSASAPSFLFPALGLKSEMELRSRPVRKFNGDIPAFLSELKRTMADGRVEIVVASAGMADRIAEILREYEMPVPDGMIVSGELSSGFEMPSLGIHVFTESDIFGSTDQIRPESRAVSKPGKKRSLGAFISDFRDLKPGDYVVHVDHGIGRFEGLQRMAAQGSEREFMVLEYAERARLFVPVERLDLVSRYSSGEASQPPIDRLGGLGWQKTKARAKRAMRDMADELLKLYAERKMVSGYAFSSDGPWQHEFEDAFPHQLTDDQTTAIEDVKDDMERATPMDRLIVGDVGYGKTEVAMRAAFKAVMDGKQVAVLTPTTVLAYQHAETFKKRFAAFPAKVELLTRFRSAKEQKEVVANLEKGEVDVIVGTHRILSADVKMPNLGLVIVDEEQRFGVAHKEKLKQLKKKVDVLTLSATPIPRTLNMSLLGMRDLSVIETPPRDRLAISTQVVQFSDTVIRSAIELEMSRGGQIFFIHNRVETIESIAAHLQKIVPNARIVFAHGQMNEKKMEQAVLDFVDFKYDVLVATTIIENGIDIPRANTIIINRADNYGLSQLYQLRGRVGRSNRRAYAYLLIPGELELTDIARRRLAAIREFSDLGAGFRIAALDLELRGAGDILGGQQSGQIDALGFDLYTRMLERTIDELRGDVVEDEVSVAINLGSDVSIPHDYILDTGQRLRTYKRISSAKSEEELARIKTEVEDRYGRLPDSLELLFDYSKLRREAEELRILSIDRSGESLAVKFDPTAKVDPDRLMGMVSKGDGWSFSPTGILRAPLNGEEPIGRALHILSELKK
jgi:transcription-repair coupling factor (superfamily II helicase)